jgi:hypothetical protein
VNHVLEPIAEESSSMEDDNQSGQLNNSIISFQNFIEDDLEPQEFSDFRRDSDSSDNEDNELDMGSDDESLDERLQQLMPRKNPRNAGRKNPKKPGPKRSSQKGRSTDIPNVDGYDPRTCGTFFLFSALSYLTILCSRYRFQYLRCSEKARWKQLPIHSPFLNEIRRLQDSHS